MIKIGLIHTSRVIFFSLSLHDDCQTLGLVLRLRVDFVLPLLQEEEEEEEEERQEPPTKIYQMGVY